MQFDADAYDSAKKDIQKTLAVLNGHLATRTYLVGHKITLADIVVVTALVDLYKRVFSTEFRKPYANVNRWFTTCINQPQFAKVIGKVDFADKEEMAAGAGAAKAKPAAADKGKQAQAQPAKKDEKKKEEKPKAAAQEDDDGVPIEKKAKNPLDSLPPSTMNLDATKKLYFEKKLGNALPEFWTQFWQNFDNAGFSVHFADYKYNDDNRVYFMTANLLNGFIQRLDEWRKYGFGNVVMLGKDEDTAPFPLKGAFIFRGTEFPATLKDDCGDVEYYTWTKVDTKNEAQRKRVQELFMANDKLDGLAVLEQKWFK